MLFRYRPPPTTPSAPAIPTTPAVSSGPAASAAPTLSRTSGAPEAPGPLRSPGAPGLPAVATAAAGSGQAPTTPESDAHPTPAKRPPIMPLFVAGFLAMVALRSTGLVPTPVTDTVPTVTNVLMAAALFGLGTGIDLRKLAKGGRAMLLGAIATVLIGTISLIGVTLLV